MKEFLKSLAFKVLAGIALFLVGIMIYAASTGGFSTIPATITGAIITPIQTAFAAVTDGVKNFFGGFASAGPLQEEIDAKQAEIDELRGQLVELDELRRLNEQYRQYLELKEANNDYLFADGRVIAVDPLDQYGNFTIDTGSLEGVKPNDPVITPSGLVGVVYEVGPTWAKVRSLLDPATQASAYVSQNGDTCITGGSASLAQEGLLRLDLLPRDTGTAVGNIIVTSGVGGVFPKGLLIGEVLEVSPSSDGLSYYAVVQPFVDVRSVTSVFVITSFTGQGADAESGG